MKNRKKQRKTFRSLQRKLFVYGLGIFLISLLLFYLCLLLSQNHFFFLVEGIFRTIGFNKKQTLSFYENLFRQYRDLWVSLLFLFIFSSLLWLYTHWITKHFQNINDSLDSDQEMNLSQELGSIENKIGQLKFQIKDQARELELVQQKKNDLIMYLAHDLKTPLAGVIGYLNLLKDERNISLSLQEKYLGIALNKTKRIEEMIEEFLDISKYSLSTPSLTYSTIDLTLLLEQVLFELEPLLKQKELSYELVLPSKMIIDCDSDKLQRVFDNILRNAILYSDQKTALQIQGILEKDQVILSFSNQGPTISAQKIERIFDQFYRLDSARSTSGSGLGLAIAKQIVLWHQGEIQVTSVAGLTTFIICLPCHGANL